jgi:hypothetical protein
MWSLCYGIRAMNVEFMLYAMNVEFTLCYALTYIIW